MQSELTFYTRQFFSFSSRQSDIAFPADLLYIVAISNISYNVARVFIPDVAIIYDNART